MDFNLLESLKSVINTLSLARSTVTLVRFGSVTSLALIVRRSVDALPIIVFALAVRLP